MFYCSMGSGKLNENSQVHPEGLLDFGTLSYSQQLRKSVLIFNHSNESMEVVLYITSLNQIHGSSWVILPEADTPGALSDR
jgi:hypothetical protein